MKTIQLFIIALFISISQFASAQTSPIDDKGLAIGGYDVVAYHTIKKAVKGDVHLSTVYKGGTYWFSSKNNKKVFEKNPSQYLPQYDGYCAWGVGAKNTKFPINPETFKIVDGKLYLFFNGDFNGTQFNTLTPWNAEEASLLKAANANWMLLKK